jgi:asparagine synthase (glutamine-hydrolysing)
MPKKMKGKNASYFFSAGKNYLSASVGIFSLEERKRLFGDGHAPINHSKGSELYKIGILKNDEENDFISNMQNLDLRTYMVDSVLTKVDRTSMMNSLEVRVPLLDHKFAELTFRIPSDLKLKGEEQKYIFKKAIRHSMPKCIINRSKKGFSIPLSMWFREDLNEYVHDTLLSPDTMISTYLEKKYVKKLIEGYFSGRNTRDGHLWTLLCLEEWLKQKRFRKEQEIAASHL